MSKTLVAYFSASGVTARTAPPAMMPVPSGAGLSMTRPAPNTVLMTAVKSRQISELKQLVQCIDPNAFMIVQPAHQVLGEGFKRYNDDI